MFWELNRYKGGLGRIFSQEELESSVKTGKESGRK